MLSFGIRGSDPFLQAVDFVSECIDQSIPEEILSKTIDRIKVLRSDGTTHEFEYAAPDGDDYSAHAFMDPTLHGGTLHDAFAQPWQYTGFETDQWKPLAGNDPDQRQRLFILNDNDAANYETDCKCSGPQITYAGTSAGLIAFGITNTSDFADAGTCGFKQFGGEDATSLVRTMWVRYVENPARCLPDWMTLEPRTGEVLMGKSEPFEITFDCAAAANDNAWNAASPATSDGHRLHFHVTPSEGGPDQIYQHREAFGVPLVQPELVVWANVALVCIPDFGFGRRALAKQEEQKPAAPALYWYSNKSKIRTGFQGAKSLHKETERLESYMWKA